MTLETAKRLVLEQGEIVKIKVLREYLLETYNDSTNEACYVPRLRMVVIFNERMRDKAHAERTWWHEQTHHFWHTLSDESQREFGLAVWNFLDKYYPETLKFIQKKYNPDSWYNEGCSFF